jgi:hypothetical protein
MMMSCKLFKKPRNILWRHLLFILVAFLFAISPAYAEDIVSITKDLEVELGKVDCKKVAMKSKNIHDFMELTWQEKVYHAIDFLKTYEKEVPPFNLSVQVAFDGNKAGEEDLYKLGLKTEMKYNTFPRAFRFGAGMNVQSKNGKFQENVTTLLVNYDYHLFPWLETYGFVERFSDSYLSIQQRYEIGGGIKYELDLLTPGWKKKSKLYKHATKAFDEFKSHIDEHDTSTDKKLLLDQLNALKIEGTRIVETLKKKYAWLSLGIAVSLFSEIEHPEIETYTDNIIQENGVTNIQETQNTEKFVIDKDHRFRIVLRPSIVIRPWAYLSLEGMYYRKLPLGSPTKIDKHYDYRTDSVARIKLILPIVPNWANEVSLIFEYHHHYNNIPPQIPQSTIDNYLTLQKHLRKTVAEKTHEQFIFSLAVKF